MSLIVFYRHSYNHELSKVPSPIEDIHAVLLNEQEDVAMTGSTSSVVVSDNIITDTSTLEQLMAVAVVGFSWTEKVQLRIMDDLTGVATVGELKRVWNEISQYVRFCIGSFDAQ